MKVNEALLQIRQTIQNPKKSANNPMFDRKYSDLNDVLTAVTDALPDNTSFTQPIIVKDDKPFSYLELHIITDQEERCVSSIPIIEAEGNKRTNKLQMLGQSITYLRRYQLQSFFGLGAEDTDGNDNQNVQQQSQGSYNRNNQQPQGRTNISNQANDAKKKMIKSRITELAKVLQMSVPDTFKKIQDQFPGLDFKSMTNDMADKVLIQINKDVKEAQDALAQLM